MKPSFPFQNQFSDIVPRHKKSLNVDFSQKSSPSVKNVFCDIRAKGSHPQMPVKKRGFDGIQTEKQALLKQLKSYSLQDILWRFLRKTELSYRLLRRTVRRFTPNIAPHKMLYGSLIGGVAFGVVSMGFIEHFFGPGVFARSSAEQSVVATTTALPKAEIIAEENGDMGQSGYSGGSDVFFEYFNEAAGEKYKEGVTEMVKGYPIEAMLPYIFEQDRLTAAFLIGIAKKESNWGKRIPVLADQDCFNYWGYRGIRRMMGTGGHTCFNSRKDAVETVAKRLNTLIHSEKLNTPEKMIIWKCGFSCSGHSRESVKKWISDVDMYFSQIDQE
jgi:hypothetical protein